MATQTHASAQSHETLEWFTIVLIVTFLNILIVRLGPATRTT